MTYGLRHARRRASPTVAWIGLASLAALSPLVAEEPPPESLRILGASRIELGRPDRWALAEAVFAGRGQTGSLGPWALRTDVADGKDLELLRKVAERLPESYDQRFGVRWTPGEGDGVVLFAEEADYRTFEASQEGIALGRLAGHAGGGVAALFAGRRGRRELALLLAHELVHLLHATRSELELPPWLEEGLAGEMELSVIRRDGSLAPAPPPSPGGGGPRVRLVTGVWTVAGQLGMALDRGHAPPPSRLVGLEHETFEAGDRRLLSAASALWVRYLLSPRGAGLEAPFKRYLGAVTGGEPEAAGGAGMAEALGREWSELDAGFRRWLHRLAEVLALGQADPRRP